MVTNEYRWHTLLCTWGTNVFLQLTTLKCLNQAISRLCPYGTHYASHDPTIGYVGSNMRGLGFILWVWPAVACIISEEVEQNQTKGLVKTWESSPTCLNVDD